MNIAEGMTMADYTENMTEYAPDPPTGDTPELVDTNNRDSDFGGTDDGDDATRSNTGTPYSIA